MFKLAGALVDANGEGIEGLLIAIVDEDDLNEDDLIGLGKTTDGGAFHITFLGSEFRQDMLEMELTPDIKIIASAKVEEGYRAIWQQSFPDLDWSWDDLSVVNLGQIVVDVDLENPTPLEGVEPFPGTEKSAAHLDIDDEMVLHCVAEVAPIVERLTGWHGLTDGLKVDVISGTSTYTLAESFRLQGIDPDSMQARISIFIADRMMTPGMGCALYDPATHTVVINEDVMRQVGLDALKVMVGHELVHVGQYKFTPGLKDYYYAALREQLEKGPNIDPEEMAGKFSFFVELEGYATYIERDFLNAEFYPMAHMAYHASFMDMLIHSIASLLVPDAEEATDTKSSQYTDGLELYRSRQVGDLPVRWQFDVASLPGGEAFV